MDEPIRTYESIPRFFIIFKIRECLLTVTASKIGLEEKNEQQEVRVEGNRVITINPKFLANNKNIRYFWLDTFSNPRFQSSAEAGAILIIFPGPYNNM